MPTISRFFGILIQMYLDDHPPPHFHAIYGEFDAQISIDTLEILRGYLPRRVHVLVIEWAMAHRPELRENWRRAERHDPLLQIVPLDQEI